MMTKKLEVIKSRNLYIKLKKTTVSKTTDVNVLVMDDKKWYENLLSVRFEVLEVLLISTTSSWK
jgi:hypothetical protein